jgi:lipopolysaccharide transport system permease protein
MARYRQTFLGAAWTVLQPLMLVLVFTVFFGLFGRAPSQGIPHPVFYYLGLLPWQVVARILNEGSASVVANASLVNRVYFPRAFLPGATIISALVDLMFGLLALAALLVAFAIVPRAAIVVLPILVAVAVAAALGVALWLSALNATYRDVAQLLPSLVQIWFFSSPIIYPSEIIPLQFRALYYVNPTALVIDGFRNAFTGTPAPPPEAWLVGCVTAVSLLVSGYLFFRKREPTFADDV